MAAWLKDSNLYTNKNVKERGHTYPYTVEELTPRQGKAGTGRPYYFMHHVGRLLSLPIMLWNGHC